MNRRHWTQEEYQEAKNLKLSGLPLKEIAKKLNRTIESVDKKLRAIKAITSTEQVDSNLDNLTTQQTQDSQSIVWTTSTPVRTVDQALEKAEVDTHLWEVKEFSINSWEQAAKVEQEDGTIKIEKTPLWQVKVWLKPKKGFSPQEMQKEIIASLSSNSNSTTKKKIKIPKTGILAELSIMDHHFGKLSWEPECGENYDVRIAKERYEKASSYLIRDAILQKPERFLIVLGNDFYHVDKGDNTTTAGTRVEADGRWQKAFLTGLTCIQQSINECLEIAPVEVICIPGNHDTERLFTLGVCLQGIYQNNINVTIHNSPSIKKSFLWGQNLLGFYHGHRLNKSRLERLPNEMAHLWPLEWGRTTWREWHLGHIHSEHEDVWRFRASESVGDVIVRRLPSLCGTDRWHCEEGYRSLSAAECHFYSHAHGRVGYHTCPMELLKSL